MYVETALRQLSAQCRLPTVLFANAKGCRGVWAGLANKTLGSDRLPGMSVTPRPALVRVNATTEELPRPVHRETTVGNPPAMTNGLYRLGSHDAGPWYLANQSRLIASGKAGRLGRELTRYQLANGRAPKRHLRADWHAMTAREIFIVDSGAFPSPSLAILTARLCQQPTGWDGRTAYPAPLHLAAQLDRDHPDYRSSIQPDSDAEL
jgi:hypothetical protein